LTLGGLAIGRPAIAQPDCVTPPVGLPGLGGPPVWFGPAGADTWRPELHDPRWAGGPVRQFPFTSDAAAADDGQYRVVVDSETLYVSFQVLSDNTVPTFDFEDAVYFGMTNGASSGARLIVVYPDRDAASVFPAAPAAGTPSDSPRPHQVDVAGFVSWFTTPDITVPDPTWTLQGGAPTGLSDVAYWEGVLDGSSMTGSPGVSWGVTLKMDLAILGVTGPMKMFFGERISNSAGIVRLGSSPLAPSDADAISDGVNPTIVPRSTSAWVDYVDPGTACTGNIMLSSSQVGVWDGVSLTNQVQACSMASCAGTTNQFRVTVQHVPATGITAHAVRTKIRFADWGSTIANWKFAPWNEIPGFTPNVFTVQQSTLTGDASWGWSTTAPAGGFVDATIDYTCDVQAGDLYCPKLTNPDNEDHQCMLVEVAAAPTFSTYRFDRAAVFRNMTFNGLSTLKRPATITIKGLQALTGQAAARDVYLYVQTVNLPPHGNEPVFLKADMMQLTRRYAENPPPIPRRQVVDGPGLVAKPGLAAAKPPALRQQATAPAAAAVGRPIRSTIDHPVLTPEQALSTAWPIYKVYVYYDTGKTTTIKKNTRKLLQPMVPFGFYLNHDGALYGFTHALEGEGFKLEQVAENFYRVGVVNEGSFRAGVTISAEEKPKGKPPDGTPPDGPPCPPPVQHGRCNCRVVGAPGAAYGGYALLTAVLGLGFWVRRRARRTRRARGR
jgi:hypothetical protein